MTSSDDIIVTFSTPELVVQHQSTGNNIAADDNDPCLKQRHWYVFLCSSFITFFVCLFVVLVGRIVSWMCCGGVLSSCIPSLSSPSTATGQQQDAVVRRKSTTGDDPQAPQIGWITEAKDWAGELISGQSTTGRILVITTRLMLLFYQRILGICASVCLSKCYN